MDGRQDEVVGTEKFLAVGAKQISVKFQFQHLLAFCVKHSQMRSDIF